MTLEDIQALVKNDLLAVSDMIQAHLHSDIPLIHNLCQHIFEGGGKRLRPLVVILGAKATHYAGDKHIPLAVAMEFFHTATLLHDDVIDESKMRRGKETANEIWGSKASVLVGDFLFTRAFQLMLHAQNVTVLSVLADAANMITRGEVLQLIHSYKPDVSEADYQRVIYEKTAVLFSAAAKLGAILSEQPRACVEALEVYGTHLGNAFQLMDDVLDFCADENMLGKQLGDDLSEGKMTMPLIRLLQQSEGNDKAFIQDTIRSGRSENLRKIVALLQKSDAIAYTRQCARGEVDSALSSLEFIPNSQYRDALVALAEFAIERSF